MKLPRLYPILDTATLARRGMDVATAAGVMLDAGIGILQLRHKEHFTRELFQTSEDIAVLCRKRGVPFVMNDRADLALMLNAGLHLGQDDLAPATARRLIGAERVLGYSTHNEAQLSDAAQTPVDYLALGPIFSTTSKENPDPEVGLDSAARWRKLFAGPIVAIGGITMENAPEVLAAGFDSVAVISGLYPDPLTPASLRERILAWQSLVKN